jgi:hypothetical protein
VSVDPSLRDLAASIDATVAGGAPLERLAAANDLAQTLRVRADELLDQFVNDARETGCSWTEIGCVLAVTKQGAQQRFGALSTVSGGTWPGLMPEAAAAMVAAAREARELGHHYIGPEHVVLGLVLQPEELSGRTLSDLGVTAQALRARIGERLGTGSPRPGGSLGVAPQTKRLLELARAFARRLGHRRARPEHVLLAAVAPRPRGPGAELLAECGADAEQIRDRLAELLLIEAPELSGRLRQHWPLATFHMRARRD